ncbi:hypothetical protein [Kluyvera georgiana]|uniref:hypothetical protein n=1 Tax=Kluyvera georgiana TaxID=73098 RepID=UPI003D999924
MSKSDSNYQVVYRGDSLKNFKPGGWVFFQRAKEYGGGYWLGRTYDGVFIIEYEKPTSLFDGISFILMVTNMEKESDFQDMSVDDPDSQLSLF